MDVDVCVSASVHLLQHIAYRNPSSIRSQTSNGLSSNDKWNNGVP